MRSASSKHASIYDKSVTDVKFISSSLLNDDRTSSLSFSSFSGFVRSKYVTPESSVAVVSEPPMIRMPALDRR